MQNIYTPEICRFRKHNRLVEGLKGVDTEDNEEGFDEVNLVFNKFIINWGTSSPKPIQVELIKEIILLHYTTYSFISKQSTINIHFMFKGDN